MLRHQNISQVCFLCSSLTCQFAVQILILPHNVKEFKQLLMFEPWVEKVNAKKPVQFRAVFMFLHAFIAITKRGHCKQTPLHF